MGYGTVHGRCEQTGDKTTEDRKRKLWHSPGLGVRASLSVYICHYQQYNHLFLQLVCILHFNYQKVLSFIVS